MGTAADEVLDAEGVGKLTLHTVKDRTKADALRIRLLKAMVALKKGHDCSRNIEKDPSPGFEHNYPREP